MASETALNPITDIDALLELNRQIGELHFEQEPTVFVKPSTAERDFLLAAVTDPERLFLVAQRDDKVIGFITASITRNEVIPFIKKDAICRVGTIVVDQLQQSAGVGQLLMQACNAWALAAGACSVRLEVMEFNASAQGFYRHLGFRTQS